MRWVGIDEAGYGPNLGPLVMTAVTAEGPGDRRPDLWSDLASTIDRAGGLPDRLWVDDSKKVYAAGKGLDRLESAVRAVLEATGASVPQTLGGWFEALGAGSLADVELHHWEPTEQTSESTGKSRDSRPFEGSTWRIVSIRSIVVGPERFNADLERKGNKSLAHFESFRRLLGFVWNDRGDCIGVRSDKHGGRHYYFDPLGRAFPDCWIDRGEEGPELSRYVLRKDSRWLELSLVPRADADDGLVALASMVSKFLRECWMRSFNAHWQAIVPDLKPTAGYPVDAKRFREVIEPLCEARGLTLRQWWRMK
ncbi:MAG TPA: hypothetical protein VFT74_13795 [Isosphaeraceae bacterium]|nr:hypothetical protein [Isosphaeraceae bacterium]